MNEALLEKYKMAVPRYTSYPTLPYWNTGKFNKEAWEKTVGLTFLESNAEEGLSLYIHLPYCESLCTYCGCHTRITKNHKVEEKYIRGLLQEWKIYTQLFREKPLIREIHLGGGTPTFFSPEHLQELIEGILEGSITHPDADFSFEAHPANTSREHLKTLYDLGFKRLSLGIQDFSPKVQDIIHRKQSFEEVKSVTEIAREIGYESINYDLIYGLPGQTAEGLVKTLEKVNLLKPDRIAFYSYAHIPWLKPGQRKYTEKDLPDFHTKASLRDLGYSLLKESGYKEIGMDHFSLPEDSLYHSYIQGTLHRNFMGYTDSHTRLLVGLGASAISDSYYAYAQNEKDIEEYLKTVEEGILPLVKGHLLTQEDLAIRKYVLNITCTGKTTWNHYKEPFESLWDSLDRLHVLEADGLIELNSWGLKVTPLGKDFLRIICMAFDARLWANKPKDPVFSMSI
jgi:oxygen-independent coproporphyrinogen-3 oxidase